MTLTKLRLILVLIAVPLAGFSCAPSPNFNLIVRPETASPEPGAVLIAVDKSQYEKIEAVVQEFASKFSAKRSAECSPRWWWNRPAEGPCAFFSNNQHEGIMIEVFYDSSPGAFRIVLVKDVRVFGRFATHDVEKAFNQIVVERLRVQYGEKSVQVDR